MKGSEDSPAQGKNVKEALAAWPQYSVISNTTLNPTYI